MARLHEEYIGETFGRLYIVRMAPTRVSPSGDNVKFFFVRCSCGKTKEVNSYSVIAGRTKSCGCLQKEAAVKENKKRTGSKNSSFNPSKTKEERETALEVRKSKRYQSWRIKVFRRDCYRCVLCGSNKKIEAHHLDGFITHKNKRFLVTNGVTLCKKCHDDFHNNFMGGQRVPVKKSDFNKYKNNLKNECVLGRKANAK